MNKINSLKKKIIFLFNLFESSLNEYILETKCPHPLPGSIIKILLLIILAERVGFEPTNE